MSLRFMTCNCDHFVFKSVYTWPKQKNEKQNTKQETKNQTTQSQVSNRWTSHTKINYKMIVNTYFTNLKV